jgi:hypothetical protein
MKARLLVLVILINFCDLTAQDSTTLIIKTGVRIRDGLKTNMIYLNPQFATANVVFRDNSKARAKMNYNSLYDQMLFIDQKGDTLAVKDEKEIQYIALGNDTFYFEEGYKRIIASNGTVKLAEKRTWHMADIRKIGSHGRSASTYNVDSYKPINTDQTRSQDFKSIMDDLEKTLDIVLTEDLVLQRKPVFYLGDRFGHFVLANRKNLLSLFPKEQTRITDYLKENKVDFNSKEDLIRLTRFLEQKS